MPNFPIADTRTENISFEKGIMKVVTKSVELHELADAIENVKVADELANGEKYKLLIDLKNTKQASIEARQYYSSNQNRNVIAAAFIIDTPVNLIIGKMFEGINKPFFPVKLFNSEEEGLNWLNTFSG
ncbi:MAG: hypothetical protein ABJG68_01990 [Crocinitomicaceae bacterium]